MSADPHPLALPPTLSPDALDALSELSVDLARVRTGIQSSTGLDTPGAGSPPGKQASQQTAASQTQTQPHQPPSQSQSHSQQQQLSFKDVPGATDGVKHKLQRARAQVRALPDMHRGLGEQRAELEELQARIEMQRALLGRLRERGVTFGKGDEGPGEKMEM